MKKQFTFLLIFASVLFFTSSCAKLLPPEESKPSPDPLEVHGGKVNYSLSVILPPKAIRKGYVYTLKNFYVYGAEEKEVGSTSLKGEEYPNSKKEQSKKSADFSFDYEASMKRGELQAHFSMTKVANNKTKEAEERITIGSGVITTSELVQPTYETAYTFHGYNDQEELIPNEISFYFAQNSAKLSRAETKREEVGAFNAFIASKNTTRKVNVTGMHSPEGRESVNTELASMRANAIEEWYRERMKKYDYKDTADSIRFQKTSVIRDWKEFREMLREYEGLSEEEKDKMLEVVNGGGTFEDKETALKELSGYGKIFKNVYPSLRTAQTAAMSVKEKRTKAEIMSYTQQIAMDSMSTDSLSHEELLYGAENTPLLSEKVSIYRAATKQKGSGAAHNNLGATLLTQAAQEKDTNVRNQLIEEASTQLEIATKTGEASAEITTNLAVAYLLQGNSERAYTSLEEASSKSPSEETKMRINAIKGALEVQKGMYDAALSSLNAASSSFEVMYNKGLTILLKKDYPQAEETFSKAVEMSMQEEAQGYNSTTRARLHYCLAISLARQDKREGILENLKKAVEADSSLKERAISDLEFRNYSDIVRQL